MDKPVDLHVFTLEERYQTVPITFLSQLSREPDAIIWRFRLFSGTDYYDPAVSSHLLSQFETKTAGRVVGYQTDFLMLRA